MSNSLNEPRFPIIPLVAAFIVMFDTIVGVGVYHARHPHLATGFEGVAALRTRDLRFVDAGDGVAVYGGHVRVFDSVTGAEYPPLRPNDGFIRAVLNSFAFERTKRQINGIPTFRLTYWSDKRITFQDVATGKLVSLGQFGAKNESVFVRFFAEPGMKS